MKHKIRNKSKKARKPHGKKANKYAESKDNCNVTTIT